jgi:hypothetical protein
MRRTITIIVVDMATRIPTDTDTAMTRARALPIDPTGTGQTATTVDTIETEIIMIAGAKMHPHSP